MPRAGQLCAEPRPRQADRRRPGGTGTIIVPDISKQVDYLIKGGYVCFVDQKITAYSKYAEDGVIELTKEGIDLIEGTIEDDGVDI